MNSRPFDLYTYLEFFGVHDRQFRLGSTTYNVSEVEGVLECTVVLKPKAEKFSSTSLDIVVVKTMRGTHASPFRGFKIVSAVDNYVWLRFGVGATLEFQYVPRGVTQ